MDMRVALRTNSIAQSNHRLSYHMYQANLNGREPENTQILSNADGGLSHGYIADIDLPPNVINLHPLVTILHEAASTPRRCTHTIAWIWKMEKYSTRGECVSDSFRWPTHWCMNREQRPVILTPMRCTLMQIQLQVLREPVAQYEI